MAQPICFIGSIDHDGSWISTAVDRVVQKRFEAVHEILATQGQSMTDILKYVKDISTTLRIQTSASTRPDFRAASYPQKGQTPGETTQTPVESTAEAPRKMFHAASPQKGQPLVESTAEAPRKMFRAASPQKGQPPGESTTEPPRKMWQPRATAESNLSVNGTKPETQELAGKVVNILPDERTFINKKTPPVFSLNHPADPRAFDPQLNSFMGENVHGKQQGTGYEKGKSKGKMRARGKQGDTPKGETRKGGRDKFGLTPKGKGHASLPGPSGVAHQEPHKVAAESEKTNVAPHVGTPSARKRTTSQPLGNVSVKAPRTVGPAKVSPSSPSSSSRLLPTPQTAPDGGASSDSGSEDLEEAMASLLDVAQTSIDEKHAPISVPNLAPHTNSPQGDSRVVSFPTAPKVTAPNEDGTSTRQKNDLLRGAEEMVAPGSVTALARKRKVRAHPVSDSKITFTQDTVPSEQQTNNVAQSSAETPRVDGQTPREIPRVDGQTPTRETSRMNGQTPIRETPRMDGQTPRETSIMNGQTPRETPRVDGQTPPRETPRVDGQTLTRETPRMNGQTPPRETQRMDAQTPREIPRVDGQTPPRETPRMDGQTPRETPVSVKKFSMKRKKRPKTASGDAENSQSAGSGRRTWAETMYEKPSHAKLVSLPSQSKTDILSFMQPSKVISSGELQF